MKRKHNFSAAVNTNNTNTKRTLLLLLLAGFVGIWRVVLVRSTGAYKLTPFSHQTVTLLMQQTCAYQHSVPQTIAAAFAGRWAVDLLQAPLRTDDHKTEHLRPKDANEQAINAMFASLQANLTLEWEAGLLPLLDQGCSSISLHSDLPSAAAVAAAAAAAVVSGSRTHLPRHIGSFTSSSSSSSGSSSSNRPKRTALLLVSDQRSRLLLHLQSYSVQLATLWHYAAAQNYGLEIYTHNDSLPSNVTGHFVKIKGVQRMFELGYDYVLGMDWDM
jgi:hypothetical protein